MMNEKIARTRREDPLQEELVERKDRLNARVKEIINLWIGTKRSWNGRAAPEIGVSAPHSITEPLPHETLSAAENLLNQTQEAVSELRAIEQAQESYSQNRKMPAPKRQPGQSPAPAGLSQELSTIASRDLERFASSAISRFVSHVTAPFSGNANKWHRLKLLRSSAAITKHLEDLGEYILTDSPAAIPNAIYKARDLFHIYDETLVSPMLDLIISENDKIKDKKIDKIPEKITKEDDGDFENDGGLLSDEELNQQENVMVETPDQYATIDFDAGLKKIQADMQALKSRMPVPEFTKMFGEDWNTIIRRVRYIRNLFVNDYEGAIKEYNELLDDVRTFTDNVNDVANFISMPTLQKSANRITRWLKRQNIKMKPSTNHQKELRLRIDTDIRKVTSSLDALMDAFEDRSVHIGYVSELLTKVTKELSQVYQTLFKLAEMYNNNVRLTAHKNRLSATKSQLSPIQASDIRGLERSVVGLNQLLIKIHSATKGQ